MKNWLVFVCSIWSINCLSNVLLTNSYSYGPLVIKKIEDKLLLARYRSDQAMQKIISFDINPFLKVECPPHRPNVDGRGCTIYFNFGSIGSMNIRVHKELSPQGMYQKILAKLKTLDPATHLEAVHFGSLFTEQSSMGSDYFCFSNHSKDGWNCVLLVKEVLSSP